MWCSGPSCVLITIVPCNGPVSLSGRRSRFGGKLLIIRAVCTPNGTEVFALKGYVGSSINRLYIQHVV